MHIDVYRDIVTEISITGRCEIDGQYECFTLEPATEKPYHEGHPCIPAGRYRVHLTPSPRFRMMTPELIDVAGRSDIRIHIGNFPRDTLGCLLVGTTRTPDLVGNSAAAFKSLVTLIKTATDPIWITIVDPEGAR